jgi:hypothetical protein
VLEASDGVGGRVRTDRVDGFLLDRGFQVMLTGYPQVQQRFDVDALELCVFEPGALVRVRGGFHRVGDPLCRPLQIPRTVVAPIGTLADKARLARMVIDVRRHKVRELLRRPATTTATRLANAGFSSRMIESFWQAVGRGHPTGSATRGVEPALRLLGERVPDPGSRAAACCWFAAASAPIPGRTLILDGERSGPAKNVAVMSEVAPSYAPPGRALLAAAVPGPHALDPTITDRVRDQLARWLGSTTSDWEHLRTDVIPHGQPAQGPPFGPKQRVALGGGLFVCGDHRDTASTQGAMYSGERAAAGVLRHLHGRTLP